MQDIRFQNDFKNGFKMNNLIGNNPDKARYGKVAGELKQTLKDWMIRTKNPYIKELEGTKL